MRVKFYRNIFIENIVKDLEYSSLNKGINFEISDLVTLELLLPISTIYISVDGLMFLVNEK